MQIRPQSEGHHRSLCGVWTRVARHHRRDTPAKSRYDVGWGCCKEQYAQLSFVLQLSKVLTSGAPSHPQQLRPRPRDLSSLLHTIRSSAGYQCARVRGKYHSRAVDKRRSLTLGGLKPKVDVPGCIPIVWWASPCRQTCFRGIIGASELWRGTRFLSVL